MKLIKSFIITALSVFLILSVIYSALANWNEGQRLALIIIPLIAGILGSALYYTYTLLKGLNKGLEDWREQKHREQTEWIKNVTIEKYKN